MTPFYEKRREVLNVIDAQSIQFPAHFHDNLELYFARESGLSIMAGGTTRTLAAGDLVLLFPNVVHAYFGAPAEGDPRPATLIICPPALVGDFRRTLSDFQPENPFVLGAQLHTDALYALRALSVPAAAEARNELADRALVQLILARTLPLLTLKKNASSPTLLQRTVLYLAEHYKEPLSLELLSRKLGVSRSHLSRLFSEQIQCGFNDYLNQLRLSEAETLLGASDLSITEVCYECGFDSQRTFNRVFQKRYSTSPREFRLLRETASC